VFQPEFIHFQWAQHETDISERDLLKTNNFLLGGFVMWS